MKKSLPIPLICTFFLFNIMFSNIVEAGGASGSVGVLNVGCTFKDIRIEPVNNEVRLYLKIQDYNSNEDLQWIQVILEYYDKEMAVFTYKQYDSAISFVKTNTFNESSIEGNLLQIEKCTYYSSTNTETIEEKCDLDLLFVFTTTWFTRILIIASDRAGDAKAITDVEYNTEEMMRSSNMIIIPGLDEPILIGISSFVLNIIAIVVGAAGAMYLAKKLNLIGSAE